MPNAVPRKDRSPQALILEVVPTPVVGLRIVEEHTVALEAQDVGRATHDGVAPGMRRAALVGEALIVLLVLVVGEVDDLGVLPARLGVGGVAARFLLGALDQLSTLRSWS